LFNILGILVALVTAEISRGQGQLVGWESIAGALAMCVAVLIIGWPLASIVRGRLSLLKDIDSALAALPDSKESRERLVIDQDNFLRRVGWLRRGYDVFTMAAYATVCFAFGWPDYVASLGVPRGLEELPEIAPYIALLCVSWLNHWRAEHASRGTWRLGAYMTFNLRGNAMMLAPVVLVSAAIFGLRWAWVDFDDAMNSFQFLSLLVQMGMMLLIVLFLPATIHFILPSTRLPDGPLRARLVNFARARKLGVREIYVWNTRSRHIATAFVIGLVGRLRYVFITDALMRELSDEEMEAVFAHELGHAHHNHLWWLLGGLFTISIVMLGVSTLLGQLPALLSESAKASDIMGSPEIVIFALTLAYGYFMFGYVSRRFERQADFFAVAHTNPEVLANVFLKLGASSGHDLGKSGWRHFSLKQRIKEIALVATRPEMRRLFNRELAMAMALAAFITLASAAALWPSVREDFVTGQMSYAFFKFDRARVNKANPAELEAMRVRVLDRAENVRDLDEHNGRLALIYSAVLDVLSGKNPQALAQAAAAIKVERDKPESKDSRTYFEGLLRLIEVSEKAAQRALANGTRWDAEFDKELAASRS
jgi:Zn-dependent protease with chaperone function